MPKFSKQTYEAVAKVIKDRSQDYSKHSRWAKTNIIRGFVDLFEDDNEAFDFHKFLDACGTKSREKVEYKDFLITENRTADLKIIRKHWNKLGKQIQHYYKATAKDLLANHPRFLRHFEDQMLNLVEIVHQMRKEYRP